MLQYHTILATPFSPNCAVVWCDQTLQVAVIDPGGDLDRVQAEVNRLGLSLERIGITHARIDHAPSVAD